MLADQDDFRPEWPRLKAFCVLSQLGSLCLDGVFGWEIMEDDVHHLAALTGLTQLVLLHPRGGLPERIWREVLQPLTGLRCLESFDLDSDVFPSKRFNEVWQEDRWACGLRTSMTEFREPPCALCETVVRVCLCGRCRSL